MVFYFFMNIFAVLYKKGRGGRNSERERETEKVNIMKKGDVKWCFKWKGKGKGKKGEVDVKEFERV